MFMRAISNETRFEIIKLLKDKGPMSVGDICRGLGFEQSRVSHNLKSLLACGFVHAEANGKSRIYALDGENIIPILDNMDRHIQKYQERLKSCGILRGRRKCQYVKEV